MNKYCMDLPRGKRKKKKLCTSDSWCLMRTLVATSHSLGASLGGEPDGALAGSAVRVASLPQQRTFEGASFPLVLEPVEPGSVVAWEAWAAAHVEQLGALLRRHGTVLFRGFPVHSAEAFHRLMASTGVPARPYIGGAAPR